MDDASRVKREEQNQVVWNVDDIQTCLFASHVTSFVDIRGQMQGISTPEENQSLPFLLIL